VVSIRDDVGDLGGIHRGLVIDLSPQARGRGSAVGSVRLPARPRLCRRGHDHPVSSCQPNQKVSEHRGVQVQDVVVSGLGASVLDTLSSVQYPAKCLQWSVRRPDEPRFTADVQRQRVEAPNGGLPRVGRSPRRPRERCLSQAVEVARRLKKAGRESSAGNFGCPSAIPLYSGSLATTLISNLKP
jgi:hypothetical protein